MWVRTRGSAPAQEPLGASAVGALSKKNTPGGGTSVMKCPKSRTILLGTSFPVSMDQQRETKARLELEHHI